MCALAEGTCEVEAITGITGAGIASHSSIDAAVQRLRRHTDLPVAVGFGIKTPKQVGEVARVADAAVVGSAIISAIEDSLDDTGAMTASTVEAALSLVRDLSAGVRQGN